MEYTNPDVCLRCSGKCCRYYMLEIDRPTTKSDFDDIRWYLCHEGSTIHVEDRHWYLHVQSKCLYLDEDNRCNIYDRRPQICRNHNPGECEYDIKYEADMSFYSLNQLDEYIAKRFNRRKGKS